MFLSGCLIGGPCNNTRRDDVSLSGCCMAGGWLPWGLRTRGLWLGVGSPQLVFACAVCTCARSDREPPFALISAIVIPFSFLPW